jgi:hypothetical protein
MNYRKKPSDPIFRERYVKFVTFVLEILVVLLLIIDVIRQWL